MSQEEETREWPVVGQFETADLCDRICQAIRNAEAAFESGRLDTYLETVDGEVFGPSLLRTYRKLLDSVPGPLQPLRSRSVATLLEQFHSEFHPTRVVTAHLTGPEGDDADFSSEAEPSLWLALQDVSARINDGPTATLRLDQMVDAGFWGIGFTFPNPEAGDRFAQEHVRRSVRRLAADILGLQYITERFQLRESVDQVVVVPSFSDKRLEQLVLDILNEDGRHATHAALPDDFFRKTDIRVKYPMLSRSKGSRVQITSIIAPDRHRAKREGITHSDEYVFLSPLSLAKFVKTLHKYGPSAYPGHVVYDHRELSECLEADFDDVDGMAFEIRHALVSAFNEPIISPLGPMLRVPPPVRRLVRAFVETFSMITCANLHLREIAEDGSKSEGPGINIAAGDRVRGRVARVLLSGVYIDMGPLRGFLRASDIPGSAEGQLEEMFAKGEEVDVEVARIDTSARRLELRLVDEDVERRGAEALSA